MEDPPQWFSLPVPHVQALAASLDGATNIPERYIRPEAEADPVADDDEGTVKIPVIDLGQAQLSPEESAKLGLACEQWGFFQLINHGVPTELVEKIKMDIVEFFKLPIEEKEAFAQIPDNSYNGYGQIFVKSEDQKLEWGDMIALDTLPLKIRKMRFWPTYPPSFRDDLDAYASELKKVTNCLLRLMAENLGVEPEIMMNNFKDMQQSIRANYYPPCPKADKVFGISPHSDATGLTILLQANDVEGLQIRNNGVWFPVKPLPGTFVVNVGDLLEIFSNGKYKSIEHRVIVNTEKERLALATFHGPDKNCILRPLPQLVKGGAENYMASTHEDYTKGYFSKKLDGKSHLESVKLRELMQNMQ
ncbi:S-norcoclaurine synthase 1-like [Iris pallida]|uniref:S-norcoclaurine synthase 1-like n=1 Tax=Iris pallida TaxID=29817 RepID=A0AAX6G9P4_IRIPA|nr:S-norcoclaurine synthase 1-like [Iris pallida]